MKQIKGLTFARWPFFWTPYYSSWNPDRDPSRTVRFFSWLGYGLHIGLKFDKEILVSNPNPTLYECSGCYAMLTVTDPKTDPAFCHECWMKAVTAIRTRRVMDIALDLEMMLKRAAELSARLEGAEGPMDRGRWSSLA